MVLKEIFSVFMWSEKMYEILGTLENIEIILYENTHPSPLVPLGLSDCVEKALLVTETTLSISLSKSTNPKGSLSLSFSGENDLLLPNLE